MKLSIDKGLFIPRKRYIFLVPWIRDIWWDFRATRIMVKILKGGYFVVLDDNKEELYRGPILTGFLSMKSDLEADCKQKYLAAYVEFFTKDRMLVYRAIL